MKCSLTESLLSAYLDGELTPAEERMVARHLRDCPQCAATYHALKATVALVADLERVPAPAGFAADVLSRVRSQATAERARPTKAVEAPLPPVMRPSFAQRHPWLVRLPQYAAAAMVLIAVGLAGYVTLTHQTRPGRTAERLGRTSGAEGTLNDGLDAAGRKKNNADDRQLLAGPDAKHGDGWLSYVSPAAPAPAGAAGPGAARSLDGDVRDVSRAAASPPAAVAPAATGGGRGAGAGGRGRGTRAGADYAYRADRYEPAKRANDAPLRLNAATAVVNVECRDVQSGAGVVTELLARNGWLSPAKQDLAEDERDAKPLRQGSREIVAAVPEGQMPLFYAALQAQSEIRVASLVQGEPRVLAEEERALRKGTADEVAQDNRSEAGGVLADKERLSALRAAPQPARAESGTESDASDHGASAQTKEGAEAPIAASAADRLEPRAEGPRSAAAAPRPSPTPAIAGPAPAAAPLESKMGLEDRVGAGQPAENASKPVPDGARRERGGGGPAAEMPTAAAPPGGPPSEPAPASLDRASGTVARNASGRPQPSESPAAASKPATQPAFDVRRAPGLMATSGLHRDLRGEGYVKAGESEAAGLVAASRPERLASPGPTRAGQDAAAPGPVVYHVTIIIEPRPATSRPAGID